MGDEDNWGPSLWEADFSNAEPNYTEATETNVQPASLWSLQVWNNWTGSTKKPAHDWALFWPYIEINNLLPTWYLEPQKTVA